MAPPPKGSYRDRLQRETAERNTWTPTPGYQASQQTRRQPYDPTRAPAGYDQEGWHLALLFRDLAEKDGVSLRAGVPVIYGELSRVFERFDLEHGSRAFQKRGDGHVERTFGQMYRDEKNRPVPWLRVGEAVIREFWSRYWDADALTYFCDLDVFEEMATRVCERWLAQRMKAMRTTESAPEPMKWNREGHKRRAGK